MNPKMKFYQQQKRLQYLESKEEQEHKTNVYLSLFELAFVFIYLIGYLLFIYL